MLRKVSSLNHPNILHFFEKFQDQGHLCMVFELLHKDLYQTIINNDLEMQLTEIRPIAKQVFLATGLFCPYTQRAAATEVQL